MAFCYNENMKFDIVTIFPGIVEEYFQESILKRAKLKKLCDFRAHDLRDFSDPKDKHRTVDDRIYGGGPGMLFKVEPFYKAVRAIVKKNPSKFSKKVLTSLHVSRKGGRPSTLTGKIILLDPKGKTFDQKMAKRFSKLDRLVFLCGRYEGFDKRIEKFVDEKVSVGNYVLSGGELPALIITEATARLIPGVLGNQESLESETHNELMGKDSQEAPYYTRPELFVPKKGIEWAVPKVLLSGDHKKVAQWRQKKA